MSLGQVRNGYAPFGSFDFSLQTLSCHNAAGEVFSRVERTLFSNEVARERYSVRSTLGPVRSQIVFGINNLGFGGEQHSRVSGCDGQQFTSTVLCATEQRTIEVSLFFQSVGQAPHRRSRPWLLQIAEDTSWFAHHGEERLAAFRHRVIDPEPERTSQVLDACLCDRSGRCH